MSWLLIMPLLITMGALLFGFRMTAIAALSSPKDLAEIPESLVDHTTVISVLLDAGGLIWGAR
jgi:hypothetical protein